MQLDQMSLFGFSGAPRTTPPDEPTTPKTKRTRTPKGTAQPAATKATKTASVKTPSPLKTPPPRDATEIFLLGRWWPIAGKEYYGNACYAKVDMHLSGACMLPKCHKDSTPHWHTWAFDESNQFR